MLDNCSKCKKNSFKKIECSRSEVISKFPGVKKIKPYKIKNYFKGPCLNCGTLFWGYTFLSVKP